MPPIRRTFPQTVFHRVEVNVVQVSRKVLIIVDGMFPVPPLRDAAFASADHDRRSRFTGRHRERGLDRAQG
jgi:hypothetical protein